MVIESPAAPFDGVTLIDAILNKFSFPSKAPPAANALVKPGSKKSAFGIMPESIGINKD